MNAVHLNTALSKVAQRVGDKPIYSEIERENLSTAILMASNFLSADNQKMQGTIEKARALMEHIDLISKRISKMHEKLRISMSPESEGGTEITRNEINGFLDDYTKLSQDALKCRETLEILIYY